MTKIITKIIIIAVIVGLVIYDIVILVEPTPGDTISAICLGWARRWWIFPLSFGVLMGHLFIPWKHPEKWKRVTIPILIGLGIISIVLNIVLSWTLISVIPLMAGIALGAGLWPQMKDD